MPQMNISKSKFVAGCQCLKRLYWQVHEPELAGEPDAAGRTELRSIRNHDQQYRDRLCPEGRFKFCTRKTSDFRFAPEYPTSSLWIDCPRTPSLLPLSHFRSGSRQQERGIGNLRRNRERQRTRRGFQRVNYAGARVEVTIQFTLTNPQLALTAECKVCWTNERGQSGLSFLFLPSN